MSCRVLVTCAVARFAKEKVAPLVKKMDEQSMMDKSIINGLFENGVQSKCCFYSNCITTLLLDS